MGLCNVIHYTSFLAERHHNERLSIVPIPPGLWFPKERKTVVLEREIEQHVQAWNRWRALTLDLSFEDFKDYRSMVEMISSVGWFQFVPILTGASALIPRSLHSCRLLWAGVLIWSMLIFHHHLHHKFGRLGCDCVGVDGLARTSREWSPNTTKVLGAWCLSPCCGMKKDRHGWTCFNMFQHVSRKSQIFFRKLRWTSQFLRSKPLWSWRSAAKRKRRAQPWMWPFSGGLVWQADPQCKRLNWRQAKLAEERLKVEALTLQLAVCDLSSTIRSLHWLDDGWMLDEHFNHHQPSSTNIKHHFLQRSKIIS